MTLLAPSLGGEMDWPLDTGSNESSGRLEVMSIYQDLADPNRINGWVRVILGGVTFLYRKSACSRFVLGVRGGRRQHRLLDNVEDQEIMTVSTADAKVAVAMMCMACLQ
jgi:hypothetical protein